MLFNIPGVSASADKLSELQALTIAYLLQNGKKFKSEEEFIEAYKAELKIMSEIVKTNE